MLNFKIVPKGFTVLEAINIIDVVLGKLQSKLFVQGIYTTDYPKHIGVTLVGKNLEVTKKVGNQITHRNPHSPLYNGNKWNHHFALSPW